MKTIRLSLWLLFCVLSGFTHYANACNIRQAEAQVGRGTMPYLTAGDNDTGATILLIHGLFAQKEQWHDVLCALADAGYRPVAPDLPGYGQTKGYDLSAYPLEAQVRLLTEFARQTGLQPQHVAGNSMGGAIAALYAREHPKDVRSLAFIGGALGIGPWADTVKNSILAGDNPFIPLTPEALDAELRMLLVHAPTLSPEVQAAVLAPYLQNTPHYIQVWNIVNLYDRVLADHAGTSLPTLILWGKEDQVFNIASADKLAAKYPRHRREDLPAVGHLPMVDAPDAVSRAYLRFLKNKPAAASGSN